MYVASDIKVNYEVSREGNIYKYFFQWDREQVKEESFLAVEWSVPMRDCLYKWHPNCEMNRNIRPTWDPGTRSSIANSAPVVCMFNQLGKNKYTCAVSEFKKIVEMKFAVNEKTAELDCMVKLPLMQFTASGEAELQIRIDEEEKDFEDALLEVSRWWESFAPVMHIPEAVTDTFYSFWYSFHQDVYPEDVEKECALAAQYGIKTVIVDDGWQTYDNRGAYAFCGDWQPLKIPNMAKHVDRVHKMGLKYILWFSVPFVGVESKNFPLFQDKLLYITEGRAGVLDPRYKEVREYLIGIYKHAVQDWGLDGLKLDFIDSFENKNNIPANNSMDIKDLYDAVYSLMTDIKKELTKVNPEIMIEFRQRYIGPAMRSYGNFFRGSDCPYDYILNRVETVDLRLLSGNTPVHSDMLMWHREEVLENCALQIINVLFSVIQLSVRLEEQEEEKRKLIRFWLRFAKENKRLLLYSKLKVYDAQNLYTAVEGIGDDDKISVIYAPDKCMTVDKACTTVINGTQKNSVVLDFTENKEYKGIVFSCIGDIVAEEIINGAGIHRLSVPPGGIIIIRRRTHGFCQN